MAGKFLAERIGLEPMDRKLRSQISNLLHYHSANAPCRGYYTLGAHQNQGQFLTFFIFSLY